jgi:hypothetical protein
MLGLVLVILFIAMSFGCENQPIRLETGGHNKVEEPNETKKHVTLETNIGLRGDALSVEYRVKNNSPKPIYLFNVLWEFSPEGKYVRDRHDVYAVLKDDGTLHLAKEAAPLPKNKRVELRIVPFTTRVDAGKDFTEKFDLSLPVSEYNPYFRNKREDTEEVKTAERVLFSIQFLRHLEEMEVRAAPLENAFTVRHKEMWVNMERLTSGPSALTVKVNRRTDYFERF